MASYIRVTNYGRNSQELPGIKPIGTVVRGSVLSCDVRCFTNIARSEFVYTGEGKCLGRDTA